MLEIAIEAAKTAGRFLKYNLGHVKNVKNKFGQEKNLVTEIDKGSEKIILGILKENFPEHSILSEEGGGKKKPASRYKWVIDPLDGTTNYTHGFPVFSVSIGLEEDGEMLLGVVYDPNFDELFAAERGKGAFLNGVRIHVSRQKELRKSMLVTGFPYNVAEKPGNLVRHFTEFLVKSQAVRRMGSAAIDLAYVAAGRYEGFWEASLNPWDAAAGVLILQEAGGKVTNYAGKKYSIYQPELVSSNGLVHAQMLQILKS